MFKRLSSFLVLFLISLTAFSSHIVGGEFNLLWKGRGYNYQLSLNMYFDDINAQPGLMDPGIVVFIFEKGTNRFITEVALPLTASDEFVKYQTPDCVSDNLRTRILRYSKDIKLDPAIYTNPAGYYVSWERCCRNMIIDNIEEPGSVGSVFYLEFPPVQKGGKAFRNSSPKFRPIQGEYFCIGNAQQYDFSAIDVNRDSLVYSLDTPWKGNSSDMGNVTPYARPYPYADVDWLPGYSQNNMIPGNPALAIDKHTGLLTVTPSKLGLYVMTVVVEEFRNGQKIGLSRRDFQFQVVECPINASPEVKIENPTGGFYNIKDTITIDYGTTTCYNLDISDPSAFIEDENLVVQELSSSLPAGVLSINPKNILLTSSRPVQKVEMCFNTCKTITFEKDSLFLVKVIVKDDACPMPLTDTLLQYVLIKGKPTHAPEIGLIPGRTSFNVLIGDSINFTVFGRDQDKGDILTLQMDMASLDPTLAGVTFPVVRGIDSVSGVFSWVPDCRALEKSPFELKFMVTDESCAISRTDSVTVNINVADFQTEITEIIPTNLITPNGDGLNDYYFMPNIPEGNCSFYFAGIEIYNRWGSKVFSSGKEDFKWFAEDAPDGLYYYLVDLNEKVMKGWIQIVR